MLHQTLFKYTSSCAFPTWFEIVQVIEIQGRSETNIVGENFWVSHTDVGPGAGPGVFFFPHMPLYESLGFSYTSDMYKTAPKMLIDSVMIQNSMNPDNLGKNLFLSK